MAETETRRVFIAIDAPAPIGAALGTLPRPIHGVAWTPPHQYHLTLRFIGNVTPAELERIEDALAPIRVEPFILPVEGVGAFPPKRPPRVLWAGIGRAHPRLFQLRQRIDDALLATGLDLDVRTFHPHFTLGRCGAGTAREAVVQFLRAARDFEAPPFRVDAFVLYQSRLGSGGAVHTPLMRVALT